MECTQKFTVQNHIIFFILSPRSHGISCAWISILTMVGVLYTDFSVFSWAMLVNLVIPSFRSLTSFYILSPCTTFLN